MAEQPALQVAVASHGFKASSAILNTLLRVLNKRVFENSDGSFTKVPLKHARDQIKRLKLASIEAI